MDFIDRLKDVAKRIPKVLGRLETEEATKNALVMPFISALGYDVFDPLEVVPEFTADVGTKKGEKVDYAIMRDGKPIILFECKTIGTDLSRITPSQLYRYFSVTDARFGVLTDGVVYQIFSDLDSPNKMDPSPFLIFRVDEVNDDLAEKLKKFHKDAFDVDSILSTASDLKYLNGIVRGLSEEWANPSEEFVRLFATRVYSGRLTESVKEQFSVIVKRALHVFVSERVNNRLKSALQRTGDNYVEPVGAANKSPGDESLPDGGPSTVTTEDELEGFYIVKAIACELVDATRIVMRDTQTYCGVLLDDNNRKPICRLFFNSGRKYLGLLDENKNVTRHAIESVHDLYKFSREIQDAVRKYVSTDDKPQGCGDGSAAS